jgi:hypothetical protein
MVEQVQQMGGEPEVVQREAQLTHHLQQSDGSNLRTVLFIQIRFLCLQEFITVLQYSGYRVRIDMALLDLDPEQ